MVGILVDLFDIQMAHYKHHGGKYTVNSAWPTGGPRSFRLMISAEEQHNRMITGMGTPAARAKSSSIAASLKLMDSKRKREVGFRRK